MSGCPFIQISRIIRSRSSSRCARSSSSAEVNTLPSVRSKRRWRRADRSEVLSQSESLSLVSLVLSAVFPVFLGACFCLLQSVRQEICTTNAMRVRTSPKHTPHTKYRAARSGWSAEKFRRLEKFALIKVKNTFKKCSLRLFYRFHFLIKNDFYIFKGMKSKKLSVLQLSW